jgi:hypothetical protein
LVGCSSGGGSVPDDYPERVRDAYCDYYARCGVFHSADECAASNYVPMLALDPSQREAIARGTVQFDAARAESCLDNIASLPCDDSNESIFVARTHVCDLVLAGTVDNGGACAFDLECRSQRCGVPACEDACCIGTCFGEAVGEVAAQGAACSSHTPCAEGLYCSDAKICVAQAFMGECNSNLACMDGTACLDHECRPLPALGEPCDLLCLDIAATYCSLDSHTCVRYGALGDACSPTARCLNVYQCDATQHCALSPIAIGAPCFINDACAGDGGFCDLTGHCSLPKAEGQRCGANEECASSTCARATSTCVPTELCLGSS